ncbi:MAG: nitroreductase family protein [Acidimicrobiales bacterium]
METRDALRARRQVRDYTDEPVDDEVLRAVLEAGRRSPSAKNWQRWDFVVITDADAKATMAETWPGAWFVVNAPVVVALVAPKVEPAMQLSVEYDLGQAAAAMLTAAADLGLGSGQSSSRNDELARSVLGFPDDRYCAHLLTFGHPADRPIRPIENPDRRPFDEVVHYGTW